MERYLISVDLDGTLLNDKKKISLKTKLYLRKLARKGHIIVINTGRPFVGSYDIYKSLGITKYPLCCNNGAVIVHFKSKEIEYETTPVDTQTITNLINEAKPYLMGGYCIDQYDHHFFGLQEIPPFIIRYYNPKSSIFCSVEKAILPSKVSYTFYIKEGKLEEAKKVFDKEEYSSLRRIYWGINDEEPSSVNFASKKANKATAIKRMQEIYSIDDEHVIAFGDSYNDIDMLNYAHYGIYMCNGRKSMIKDAKYITKKDNNHNGIVDYLKKNFKL